MVTRQQILEWMRATERRDVEFKLKPPEEPKTIWKTVTGLANLGGGCIIFGVGDRKDEAGNRELRRMTLDAEATSKEFERIAGGIRSNIVPATDVKYYDVVLAEDQTVVVLEVPPPLDPYLRLYQGKAYTRAAKPETVEMKPEEIWHFHYTRARFETEERLNSLQPNQRRCLAKMAFRMCQRGAAVISEDDAKLLILQHESKEVEALWKTVLSQHIVRWSENAKELRFVSRAMRDLYASLYLNQLPRSDLSRYLADPFWHNVVFALAGIAGTHQVEFMISSFFEQGAPFLAVQCFLTRNERVSVDRRLRDRVIDSIVGILTQSDSDSFSRMLVLDLVGREVLHDPDDFLRMQVLESLSGIELPIPLLITLLRHLDPDHEPNGYIRYLIATVFSEAKTVSNSCEKIVEGLIEALEYDDPDFQTFEATLYAVAHFASGMAAVLSEGSSAILSRALYRYETEIEEPSQRAAEAIERLEQLITGSLAS